MMPLPILRLGKRIRVVQTDGMRFAGPVRELDQTFFILFDEQSHRDILITVESIFRIEVLND